MFNYSMEIYSIRNYIAKMKISFYKNNFPQENIYTGNLF